MSGITKLVETNKLYTELGWIKLSDRRSLHKLFLFFKMENGLTPHYLSDLIPARLAISLLTISVILRSMY